MQGGGGRSSGNNRDVQGGVMAMAIMRKGPWMAEEDEILLEYVRKHGPRDWSSIRSKGLLPRTGKSCRLRWVNKLKPDLKTGCKFSPEEERIVIDLQGRFGNKWARIATYLPGRTDNDVKNFWSTRQKRLARILQAPLPNSKHHKNHGKQPSLSVSNEVPTFEVGCLDLIPFGEESSSAQCSHTCNVDNPGDTKMLQNTDLVNLQDTGMPLVEPPQGQEPPQLHFDHLPNPVLDFPFLPEGADLIPGLGDIPFEDEFGCPETDNYMQLPDGPPFFGLGVGRHCVKIEDHSVTPDSFFDDFPADMFDYLEPPPPPTSSAAW